MANDILTTMVGAFPAPDWLIRNPGEMALRDATERLFDRASAWGTEKDAWRRTRD